MFDLLILEGSGSKVFSKITGLSVARKYATSAPRSAVTSN